MGDEFGMDRVMLACVWNSESGWRIHTNTRALFLSLSLPAVWSDPVLAGREEQDLVDPSHRGQVALLRR
jgi:hypothetical protein